jgi:hypothetical protein
MRENEKKTKCINVADGNIWMNENLTYHPSHKF